MRYSIFINQPKSLEWKLNLSEASIFSFIYELPSWAESGPVDAIGDIWFFCSKNKIVDEFPLLTSKRDTVYRLLISLKEKGLINYKYSNGKDWVQITEKGKAWNIREGSEKNPKESIDPRKIIRTPPENFPINKTSIDSNTKNTHTELRQKKIDFLKRIIDWAKINPGKYPKLMYNEFAKYWIEQTMNGKVKLRFEEQKFFDIARRLSTWLSKTDNKDLQNYWEQEEKTATINDLFKKLL